MVGHPKGVSWYLMKAGSCFSKTLAMSESSASSFSLSESPAFLLFGMESNRGKEEGRRGRRKRRERGGRGRKAWTSSVNILTGLGHSQ